MKSACTHCQGTREDAAPSGVTLRTKVSLGNLWPRFALVSWFGFRGMTTPPMLYFTAPRSGPHINAITEEKGRILISWDKIPAQEQMGCILHYRIYWKEQSSTSQPRFCGTCEKRMLQGLPCSDARRTQAHACAYIHRVLVPCLALSRCSINIVKLTERRKRHLNS